MIAKSTKMKCIKYLQWESMEDFENHELVCINHDEVHRLFVERGNPKRCMKNLLNHTHYCMMHQEIKLVQK